MKIFKGLKMLRDEKESKFFVVVISYGGEKVYKQRFHESYVINNDKDFVSRIIANVNKFEYKPLEI